MPFIMEINCYVPAHAKEKIRQHFREPHVRILSAESLLLANGGNINPALIPILSNTGASTTDKLMQLILAGKGEKMRKINERKPAK